MRTHARISVLLTAVIMAGSFVTGAVSAADPTESPKPSADPKSKTTSSGQLTPQSLPVGADIGEPNAGPLTHIVVGQDLSCAVNHRDDGSVGEFYGDRACGTFLALNGTLYGPPNIPAGGNASTLMAWTPVSQTVTGDGSGGIPKKVVTEVVARATNVHVIEREVLGWRR